MKKKKDKGLQLKQKIVIFFNKSQRALLILTLKILYFKYVQRILPLDSMAAIDLRMKLKPTSSNMAGRNKWYKKSHSLQM